MVGRFLGKECDLEETKDSSTNDSYKCEFSKEIITGTHYKCKKQGIRIAETSFLTFLNIYENYIKVSDTINSNENMTCTELLKVDTLLDFVNIMSNLSKFQMLQIDSLIDRNWRPLINLFRTIPSENKRPLKNDIIKTLYDNIFEYKKQFGIWLNLFSVKVNMLDD